MKQWVPVVAAVAVVGAFSTAVLAQSADRAIKYRQGVMSAMGWHLGILGGMAKGSRPYDKEQATKSAQYIHALSDMPWEGYIPGSHTGAPTKAKQEIWAEPAKFDKYGQALRTESSKLASAAGNGVDGLRSAIGPVVRACDGCHDDFRSK